MAAVEDAVLAGLPVLVWDPADVPVADRFDVFDAASRAIFRRTRPRDAGPFSCDATDYLLGDLVVSRLAYDPHAFTRTEAHVRTGETDAILVQLNLAGSTRGAVGGRELVAAPDRVVIQDLAHPFTGWSERSGVIGIVIPRHRIACHDWIRDRAPVIAWRLDTPTGRVLASAVRTLWDELPCASVFDAPLLADGFVGLVNGLLRPTPEHEDDVRRALAVAIKQHVAEHLDDLALDADGLRMRFYCSRTTLYRIFEEDGGVARYIRELRLRACFHDLTRRGSARGRVSEVATRWGFENPSHFNRLFKAAFGTAPSAVVADTDARPRGAPREMATAVATLDAWLRRA